MEAQYKVGDTVRGGPRDEQVKIVGVDENTVHIRQSRDEPVGRMEKWAFEMHFC